ncbi:hypothetical protein CEXT_231921 [Caerostris extrusa]|uniref:Uncharacterized protein n=1 Tax=Caerostris extrusa TaxID=172846 RepID=A0AAV4SR59_CAEEX|nr:hypothetical protein CEXT_231921 [Caerostris extrusa]
MQHFPVPHSFYNAICLHFHARAQLIVIVSALEPCGNSPSSRVKWTRRKCLGKVGLPEKKLPRSHECYIFYAEEFITIIINNFVKTFSFKSTHLLTSRSQMRMGLFLT